MYINCKKKVDGAKYIKNNLCIICRLIIIVSTGEDIVFNQDIVLLGGYR